MRIIAVKNKIKCIVLYTYIFGLISCLTVSGISVEDIRKHCGVPLSAKLVFSLLAFLIRLKQKLIIL